MKTSMDQITSNEKKENITSEIRCFVEHYAKSAEIAVQWGTPMVGFADAFHPSILALKATVSPSHALPADVLAGARIVIACYVPFTKELALANNAAGRMASPKWAQAYEQTNSMFTALNKHLIEFLARLGFQAAAPKEAQTFDQEVLISDWSHRHFAYAAGLGTFGLNNMLITKNGCCGRYTTLVTNLDVKPDAPMGEEICLYRRSGICGICVKKCPVDALSISLYDRQKCYSLLRENARIHTGFGSSYLDAGSGLANSEGSEVCGKCVTAAPCAFWKLK